MNKNPAFIISILSRIDDDIIERNTEKRMRLFSRTEKAQDGKKTWLAIVAIAACALLVLGAGFGTALGLLLQGDGKQVPVYQGMTVSHDPPTVNTAEAPSVIGTLPLSAFYTGNSSLNSLRSPSVDSPLLRTEASIDASDASPDISTGDKYYAKKNEDIYIYVHLSNPDDFEILSFTLNGVKYSSYMFEDGSDLETLILKYNVGETEGLQEYTIDAIKYVDGDKIKDVRMLGDQTIEVYVNTDNHAVRFNAHLEGWNLVISPEWAEGIDGFTSLSIYDGNQKLCDYEPTTTVFSDLPEGKRLILIGTYMLNGKTESVSYAFDSPKQSEGLLIANGRITGIGNCTDSVLYLNMPISDYVFREQLHLTEIYFGKGVTSIGEQAFAECTSLESIAFAEGLEIIGTAAFGGCTSLKSITLPDSLTTIGNSAFGRCTGLSSMTIGNGLTHIEGYTYFTNPPDDSTSAEMIPVRVLGTFSMCPNLTSISFKGTMQQWQEATGGLRGDSDQNAPITIYCSDGELILENNG